MDPIGVVINGVTGRMGREVASLLCREPDLAPLGAASRSSQRGELPLPDGSGSIPLSGSLEDVIAGADVVVDFTSAEGAMSAMETAARHKANVVTGATALSPGDLERAEYLSREHGIGIIVAPNFALGAVLLVHLAKIAGPFFDYAELTEMHHEAKADAPSGTALAIAQAVVQGKGAAYVAPEAEKQTLQGTRGGVYQGVSVHSGRMPGRMAHHELVFGALGQTLTLRHDSINRESFMPGVALAVREVVRSPGLTVGLENILGLG